MWTKAFSPIEFRDASYASITWRLPVLPPILRLSTAKWGYYALRGFCYTPWIPVAGNKAIHRGTLWHNHISQWTMRCAKFSPSVPIRAPNKRQDGRKPRVNRTPPENEKDRRIRQLEQLVEERTAQLSIALKRLEQSYDDTLEVLGGAQDLKDAETAGHCQRVTAFCISIAKAMPVPDAYLAVLARAAFLHDIGKMAIPDSILRKPGPLDNDEKTIMRTHCEIGYNVLRKIPFLRDAAEIVLAHQEFFDGTGYPNGLRGEAIPLGARIFSIADALDAMISDRPYRRALPMSHAREEIRRCAGSQFDPKIVQVFLSIPEQHWIDLRENLGSPFRLAQLKNLKG